MTDEIDVRIALDNLASHIRRVAQRFDVTPSRNDMLTIRAILENILPSGYGGSPGDPQRVESELMDYDPVAPYRVCVAGGDPEPFTSYRAANMYARTQSGANRIPVFIRDAADVVTWAIRFTNEPLGS